MDMIQDRDARIKALKDDESELKEQLSNITDNVITLRKDLSDQINQISNVVVEQISVLDDTLCNSKYGKLTNIIKSAEDDLCQICCENPIDSALIPCGHYMMCGSCSDVVAKYDCPVCRISITGKLKIFKS